jgi:hypothetical protein
MRRKGKSGEVTESLAPSLLVPPAPSLQLLARATHEILVLDQGFWVSPDRCKSLVEGEGEALKL